MASDDSCQDVMPCDSQNDAQSAPEMVLTKAQKAQIERNRQRALLVKEARANKRSLESNSVGSSAEKTSRPGMHKDTGGGFLLEEEDIEAPSTRPMVIHPPGALIDKRSLCCDECSQPFNDSYLFDKFSWPVCDQCKDINDRHRLITRTDAKTKYLLKDADLDSRQPALPFIVKKNPHNDRWGDMKLYLECQVAELAQTVWGSDDKLDEAKEKRVTNREVQKKKKFDKKVKELRKAVRGSLYRKATAGHEHEFGEDLYDEERDVYTKTCTTCGHSVEFEKM